MCFTFWVRNLGEIWLYSSYAPFTEVKGWWSSAGGWLIWRVQDDFIHVPGTRLGPAGPPFPRSPSSKAVGRLPWLFRAPGTNVPRDAKWQRSASWACTSNWHRRLPPLLSPGYHSPLSHGGRGRGSRPHPDLTEGGPKKLWPCLICHLSSYVLCFWPVGKMRVTDQKVTGYRAVKDIGLNLTSLLYRLKICMYQ